MNFDKDEIIDLMESLNSTEDVIIDQDIEDECDAEEGLNLMDDDYIPILDDDADKLEDIEDDTEEPYSESAIDDESLKEVDNINLCDIVDEFGIIN